MSSRLIGLDSSDSKWKDFIDPNCFIELEENIKSEKNKLNNLYDRFQSTTEDPMFFLRDEKEILETIEELELRKYDLLIKYDEAIYFLYGQINTSNTDYPHSTEVNGKIYYFRLNFDPQEYNNSDRKYYIEVSSDPTSGYERIRLISDDSNMKIH